LGPLQAYTRWTTNNLRSPPPPCPQVFFRAPLKSCPFFFWFFFLGNPPPPVGGLRGVPFFLTRGLLKFWCCANSPSPTQPFPPTLNKGVPLWFLDLSLTLFFFHYNVLRLPLLVTFHPFLHFLWYPGFVLWLRFFCGPTLFYPPTGSDAFYLVCHFPTCKPVNWWGRLFNWGGVVLGLLLTQVPPQENQRGFGEGSVLRRWPSPLFPTFPPPQGSHANAGFNSHPLPGQRKLRF